MVSKRLPITKEGIVSRRSKSQDLPTRQYERAGLEYESSSIAGSVSSVVKGHTVVDSSRRTYTDCFQVSFQIEAIDVVVGDEGGGL